MLCTLHEKSALQGNTSIWSANAPVLLLAQSLWPNLLSASLCFHVQYVTWHSDTSWCFNAQYCNKTNYYDGKKTPGVLGDTHTWEKDKSATTGATHQQEQQQEEAKATLHQISPPAAATLAGVRELASLSSPWYFGAVPVENASIYASSWDTAFDPDGLGAPFGLRTAEKRNPGYFCDKKRPGAGGGCCNWSGPMWPFETAKAISAAIRVLNSYSNTHMSQEKLWTMMWQYAASHTPLWKVINTTNGEFCNLDDPHSDLKSWLLPGTQNSWIAVRMLLSAGSTVLCCYRPLCIARAHS